MTASNRTTWLEPQVRVSYIVTTFNRAQFLDKALENIREIFTPADELIVVDAGSTDETQKVVGKYQDIITVFRSEPDFGEAHGFNKGILASRGLYIRLVTDDDYIYPQGMRTVIDFLEDHPELDAVICGGEEYRHDPVTGQLRLVKYQHLPPHRGLFDDITNIFDYVACGVGLVIRRRVISQVGLLDTTAKAVDVRFMGRLIRCHANFKYLNIKLYRHVEYAHSGQKNLHLMDRDRLHVLLENKEWDKIVDYSRTDVAAILGLDTLPGGMSLTQLIFYASRLRQGPLRPLVQLFAFALSCGYWLVRGLKWVRGLLRPNLTRRQSSIVEPVWDGSTR